MRTPPAVWILLLSLMHCDDDEELCSGSGCSLMPHGNPRLTNESSWSRADLELGARHLAGMQSAEGLLDFTAFEPAQAATPADDAAVRRPKARVVYSPPDGLGVFPLESLDAFGWSCEGGGDWLTVEGGAIECGGPEGSRSRAVRWPLSGSLERTSAPPSQYMPTARLSERLTFHASDGGEFRGVATYRGGGAAIDCY